MDVGRKILCCTFMQSIKDKANKLMDFPSGSDGKESAYDAGDQGLIPGSGISPGEGNGNPR